MVNHVSQIFLSDLIEDMPYFLESATKSIKNLFNDPKHNFCIIPSYDFYNIICQTLKTGWLTVPLTIKRI